MVQCVMIGMMESYLLMVSMIGISKFNYGFSVRNLVESRLKLLWFCN